MSNILSIIIVAVLGILGNITYFEYRLRKEHRKETIKEQLTKLLMPLYIILQTDELEWAACGDLYEHIANEPDRLVNPIKNILDKNLYLADDELQLCSLSFIAWAYSENSDDRFQKLHYHVTEYNVSDYDKELIDFRNVVYKKYNEQRKKYLK